MTRTRCPDCKHRFDIDLGDLEEGDLVSCPECNFELTLITTKKGVFKLQPYKDKLLDEDEDFDVDENDADDFESQD